LGVKVNHVWQEQVIYINQSKYKFEVILRHFGMAKNKSMQNLFITNCKHSKDMGPWNEANLEMMQAIMFLNVVGSFMYATWYV